MTTTDETLAAILAELREIRKELGAPRLARVFVPEGVRRALGADSAVLNPESGMWRLTVWFGPVPTKIGPTESACYTALSDVGFTTEEAIEVIARQRPTVPA